jgi:hypothetical protein
MAQTIERNCSRLDLRTSPCTLPALTQRSCEEDKLVQLRNRFQGFADPYDPTRKYH